MLFSWTTHLCCCSLCVEGQWLHYRLLGHFKSSMYIARPTITYRFIVSTSPYAPCLKGIIYPQILFKFLYSLVGEEKWKRTINLKLNRCYLILWARYGVIKRHSRF